MCFPSRGLPQASAALVGTMPHMELATSLALDVYAEAAMLRTSLMVEELY